MCSVVFRSDISFMPKNEIGAKLPHCSKNHKRRKKDQRADR